MMKKVIATLLAVCMLLMMIPAIGVSAESAIAWPANIGDNVVIGGETYEYIGDMCGDFDQIVLDESDLDRPQAGRFGAGYFAWDGEDTLVLNGTTGSFEEVYSTICVDDMDANIVFEGKNVWNVTNVEEESYYTFDLYDEYGEENVVSICGTGSLELNVTSDSYVQVFYGEPDLRIYDVEMDVSVSAADANGIKGYKSLEIENADISIDVTFNAMNSSRDLVIGEDELVIKDSTLNIKGRDRTEYADVEAAHYFDGIESYGDVVIDNSIVNVESESQSWAYGIYADGNLDILNGSAIELKGTGSGSYTLGAEFITIKDSYVRSIAEGSESAIAIDAWVDSEISILLEDAELIAPANGTIKHYVDEEEEAEGTSVFLPDDTYAAEVVIAPRSYADVGGAQWFTPAIGFATARGLFKGVNSTDFAPDAQFTRAQMMTVLARMAGEDVTPAAGEVWYKKAVDWAKANGVSDGTDPDGKITREQMITMVWRYLGEPEGAGDLTQFTDRNKIDSWAKEAMEWAVEYKIISGKGAGILDPDGNATRAEAAQLLKNFLINY